MLAQLESRMRQLNAVQAHQSAAFIAEKLVTL
jgi:hypothetical protein